MTRFVLLALGAFAYACSGGGGGCGGCGGTGDGPPYVFEGDSAEHVVFQGGQVHVTQSGLDRISDNLDSLLGSFLGGESLSFCLAAQDITVATLCGEETCDDGSTGCQLDIGIGDVDVVPERTASPSDDRIRIEIELLLDEVLSTSGLVSCDIGLSTPGGLPVAANVYMNLDPPEWERVHIDFPSDELEYDLNDLTINISGGILGSCAVLNLATDLVLGLVGDQIGGIIDGALGPALCTSCASSDECPVGSTCDGESCIVDGTTECVPLALGVETEFDLGDLLADFAPGLEAKLGILAYAANYADAMGPPGTGLAYEGIDLGLELGFYSDANPCVPWAEPPATPRVPKSPQIYTDLTPSGDDFGVGIGVSRSSLNLAGWAFYRSGALCISVGSDTISQIATGTFSVLLPSLGDLVDGQNRPMYLQIRPQRPPTIDLGLGTTTDEGEIDDPLLTLNLNDLDIDFYVFAEDRYVRLMTLNSDVAVPLALDVNDDNQIVILLGDLGSALGDMETRNAELLSQRDADAVATVLPTLIGALIPTLVGDAIAPIDIPELAEGVSLVIPPGGFTSVDDRQMLAIFADLAFGAPAPKAAPLRPEIVSMHVDRASADAIAAMLDARAAGAPLDLALLTPTVTLDMDAYDPETSHDELEYSYRLDDGMWNTWHRGDRLVIDDPAMALSGTYEIDVQARAVGARAAADPIVASTTVTVDYVPPSIDVSALGTSVSIAVEDLHTPGSVDARYRLDGGAWRRLDGAATLEMSDRAGTEVTVDVEASDANGNRAVAKSTVSLVDETTSAQAPRDVGQSGCSAAPGPAGGFTLLLGLLGLVFVRRRAAAVIATVALGVVLGACGNDSNSGSSDVCEPECADWESCVDGVCNADECTEDADCGEGAFCVGGFCAAATDCTTDDDCPEGAICADGSCEAAVACTDDGECGDDQYCDDGTCRDYECVSDEECGDCGEFQTPICVDNACACQDPCADGCEEGSTCCESRDECVEIAAECEPEDCELGYHVQPLDDPVFHADTCEVTVECGCVKMPPLPLGNTGVYLDIGVSVDPDVRAIAAYNSTYGDLMVGAIDGDDEIAWEFVDGLSDDDTVTGALDGPRGGIATGGPNVGEFPSVAVGADGALHVAYYAATGDFRRSLLYAHGAPAGDGYDWTFLQLDATDGAGQYTDIEIGADGMPMVGYVVPAVRLEDQSYQSQVRVVKASSATPTTVEDWGEPIVVTAEFNNLPCGASCVGRQQCRLDTNVCSSTERDSACEADCGDGACFANEDGPATCSATDPGKPEGPAVLFEGIGVFLDMEVLPDDVLGFAFYDHSNGDLGYAATSAATPGTVEWEVIDGRGWDPETETVVDTGDAGWYPDLFAAADGTIYISYAEASSGVLRIADLTGDTTTPVDDGVRCYDFDPDSGECTAPLKLRVGYDSAIAEDEGGLYLVYQDATWHEVLESPLGEFGWDLPGTIAEAGDPYSGAYGFYLGHGVGADGRFVVSYRLNQRAEPPVRDTVVIAR